MKRLRFDSQGKLLLNLIDVPQEVEEVVSNLKKSDSLQFLKEEKFEQIKDTSYWSLNDKNGKIPPLKFSNQKTQEDIVKEITDLIKKGEKIIFLHGACGTGKSAIALNIARILGKTSIIVPVKNLQRQYEEDYMENKFLLKSDGRKIKIAMMTGRENHDSLINPGVSCADPTLPENIKITEKNYSQIADYYKENPFLSGQEIPELKNIKRISIAPANPYWSPIIRAELELNNLKDAKKIRYKGVGGKEYIFYHRKSGCSYYDQYLAYKDADIIIFNSAKYKAELSIGRKPETEVEVIDEADEFLDSLFDQEELNITRLSHSLTSINPEKESARQTISEISELIKLEEQNKRALGIDENKVFSIEETKIDKILQLFLLDHELEAEILIDELNYSNKALEISNNFVGNFKDIYLTYRKEDDNLIAKLVSTNLSGKIKELIEKNKALVFMSGTLHSESVLRNIFGIKNFKVVEAETLAPGSMEIIRTGKEFDCKYSNFQAGRHSREDYLSALSSCIAKAPLPALVHVNAYQDLPSEPEKTSMNLQNLTSKERLIEIQSNDKTGKLISIFKQGLADKLFTTKCSRGVNFPGNMCRSVVFTKYPYPNISDTFWKILQKTHPEYFWDFYKDKAYREFLQRIYRAIRSQNDHVYVLSPDIRVIDEVRKLQNNNYGNKK